MIIDTHAHIDQDAFDEDRDAVVERARQAGVQYMVNVGCDIESSYRSVVLSELYDFVYATAGVHPHDVKTIDGDTYLHLRELLSHPRVVALGETGLDYFKTIPHRNCNANISGSRLNWRWNAKNPSSSTAGTRRKT